MEDQSGRLDHKQLAMFCHLSALSRILIPFGNVIAPLILWTTKKGQDPYIDEQGKEVVNFQIFISIIGISLYLIAGLLPFLGMFMFNGLGVGYMSLHMFLGLGILIFSIIGALKAKEGVAFKYPTPFKFLN